MQCSVGKRLNSKKRYRLGNVGQFGSPTVIQRGLLMVPDLSPKELHGFGFVSYITTDSVVSVGCLPVSNFVNVSKLIEPNKFIRLNNMLVRFFGYKHVWNVVVRAVGDGVEKRVSVTKSHAFLSVDRKLLRVKSLREGDQIAGAVPGKAFEVVSVGRGSYQLVAEVGTTSPNCLYSVDGLASGNVVSHRKSMSISSHGMMVFRTKNGVVQILLVRNRYSWAFLDLIRGKYYNQPLPGIVKIFLCEVTQTERKLLETKDFREIWTLLEWPLDESSPDAPFMKAKAKFEDLDVRSMLTEVPPSQYVLPEVGLPKGRTSGGKETTLETAKRETMEETGLLLGQDYILIEGLDPIVETFIGTNGVKYRHTFYLSKLVKNDVPDVKDQTDREISQSFWASKSETLRLVRGYETAKRSALTTGFDLFERFN